MSDLDWLGQDGGKLAMAFAAGCVATFGFMTAIGHFLWKLIGGHRQDRIDELKATVEKQKVDHARELAEERQACALQIAALTSRIQQLETIFTMHTGIQIAHIVPAVSPAPAGMAALAMQLDAAPDSAD